MNNLNEILSNFQSKLNAPKNQRNNFGKYNYRSSEDILEGLKPLIKEHQVSVTLSDEIVLVGNRIYVKATATISNDKDKISSTAYAREPEMQKGMSEPQITGSASSYARKYALNGLFAIDDTKDNDHDSMSSNYSNLITDKQHQELRVEIQNKNLDYTTICSNWNMKNLSELQQNSIVSFKEWLGNQ